MRESTPAPGRPARLSREAIVTAALQSDLHTLTMRELATRLGVSHSALYRWVPDRDGLFDLISDVMVERILPSTEPTEATWRDWLRDLAWKMHDEFRAVPGYAAHVAAPHRHNPESFGRLRDRVLTAFRMAGASEDMAEQSWFVFGMSVVHWIGADHADYDLGEGTPRFDLFLDVLLRGLPAQEDARPAPTGG
ncbi:TetR/AcrR family transcriptional regulator [Gordonia sp. (in: high G+C Gram-positive bacteria)]|uniref:TetR/AcrR family transcriptional regulator n=1 Tax=Gordonia sp. (in: high G+C Gram-positive bacteria) TaxID=84139 RepID=UPI0039E2781D